MITPEDLAGSLAYDARLVKGDTELEMVFQQAIKQLNGIAWERFRVKCEASSTQRLAARRRVAFVRRHKR